MSDILEALSQAARGAAQGRGLRVQIKTNLGPAVTVYDYDDPTDKGAGFVKAGVIFTDRQGKQLASYGDVPATDWLLLGSMLAVVGVAAVLMVRGLKK